MIREALYESTELSKSARDSAALLASKVYYFLGEYDEALSFALGAGSAFEAESRAYGAEEFVETVICKWSSIRASSGKLIIAIAKAIDRYIQLRSEETPGKHLKIDPRLQGIIEGIFKRCIEDGEYKQVSTQYSNIWHSCH